MYQKAFENIVEFQQNPRITRYAMGNGPSVPKIFDNLKPKATPPRGAALAMTLACLLATACQTPGGRDPRTEPERPVDADATVQTFIYECEGGFTFTARTTDQAAWLFLPGEAVQLPRVPAVRGNTYRGTQITLTSDGANATLESGSSSYRHCRNNRAKAIWEHARLNGVDFRATGNEPGWNVEITLDQDIVLITDYGTSTYRFATPDPDVDQAARTTTYTAVDEKHQLKVLLQSQPCIDSMSGDPFEVTVTVFLDDSQYRGCGTALH